MRMRITIATSIPAVVFMRRAGYGFQKEASGETTFVRRVSGGMFPRCHAYVVERSGVLEINLHVDQKAPTYGTERVHSGEYEGPLVEQESARLREFVTGVPPTTPEPPQHKTGFLGRWFG